MRSLYLVMYILAAGLFFSSCKKEDKNTTPESSIMGIWKAEKLVHTLYKNEVIAETSTSFWKTPDYMTFEFKNGNQLVYAEFSDNELDTDLMYYKIVGDKLMIMEDANDPFPEEYTFKISGKQLVLSESLSQVEDGNTWRLSSELHFNK